MDRRRPPIAWTLVIPVAAAELLLLVATANRYGYHRDELYFRVAGQHPAWGYDDQPALTPLIGRFSEWLFGEDPRGLRVMSAVAMALVVVLAALIARELGAGRTGQVVAALAVAASGGTMAVGHLLSTTTFDVLVWVAVVYLVARLLGGGDARQWLLVGLAVGVGLENKHLVLLLVAALGVGCVVERRWELGRTPWAWTGAALAFVLWLPNLLWQARHGWPQLELASKIGEEDAIGNRIQLLPLQVLLIGPLLAALWIAGLWWLLRRDELRAYRPLGLAYLALLAIALVTGGKPYYTLGLLLALFGAAGLVAERSLEAGQAPPRTPRTRDRSLGGDRRAPRAPARARAGRARDTEPDVNEDAIETIGWPTFTAVVAHVWTELPPAERAHAVVYASNYGEAGAIARVRPCPRHPPCATRATTRSGASGAHPTAPSPVIVIGYRNPASLQGTFAGCTLSATHRQRRRRRQRGAGSSGLDLRQNRRALVTLWPPAAGAQPVAGIHAWEEPPRHPEPERLEADAAVERLAFARRVQRHACAAGRLRARNGGQRERTAKPTSAGARQDAHVVDPCHHAVDVEHHVPVDRRSSRTTKW